MKNKPVFRQVVNTLHLWVGIPCAIILFIVCITGTTYVFQKEIIRWVDSDKYKVTNTGGASSTLSPDSLISLLESSNKGLKATVVQIPEKKNEAWLFTLAPPAQKDAEAEKAEIKKNTRIFIVNPYTGTVQGDAQSTAYRFFETVIELHRWLLMDHSVGAIITGTAAFLFLLLEITGLILWMPAKLKSWKKWNAWRPGFGVKKNAGWKRVNHDLHKTFGFYSFLFITVMALTGPYFGFEWYKNAFAKTLGTRPAKKDAVVVAKTSTNAHTPNVLLLDSMLNQANQLLPYPGDVRLNLPKGQKGTLSILKVKTGFFASAATDRIDFDPRTNSIKKIDLFKNRTGGEKIVSMVRAIHTGELFGTFSKILYFIACLIGTSLPVTGVFIWLNKRKKKKPTQVRSALKGKYADMQI
ncbi:MAG: PepSY-associated TM helix domain-containing protein [Chitinophagaceae bacterium]